MHTRQHQQNGPRPQRKTPHMRRHVYCGLQALGTLLIRPCEVLSRVANVTILEVANNALRVLLQHRHVIIGSLA